MTATDEPGSRRKVVLLASQAFTLGLVTAWLNLPASTIFLDRYGSGLLPVTYLGAAAAGAGTTALLGRALRHRPLPWVASRLLVAMAVLLAGAWLGLWLAGLDWLSFALLVLVPMVVPVGFVIVVGQAGMLLDVRAMKALYARVIAGFALGYVAGGVGGPPLLGALGGTEHLLAAATLVAVLFLVLVEVTRRSFPTALAVVADGGTDGQRPTLRSLLSNRFVVLVMAYQMLSAVESQWLDFLVFDRAGRRYDDSRELAGFVGRFFAISYGTDIVFLLVFAGIALRRFGLRYGLTANPAWVLTLVVAVVGAAVWHGSGATIVFVLIVATRVSDLVLSDGTTRTSVGAAYQAIAPAQRLAAQANVEGVAVPVAIGFAGVVLIAVRATVGTEGIVLPVLTAIVLVAWVVVAFAGYRDYRVNLLHSLRHRTIDPADLAIDSSPVLTAIEKLLASAEDSDVRLALDVLESAGHETLVHELVRLSTSSAPNVRVDALDRLTRAEPAAAAAAARTGLHHPVAAVRAACARALGATGDAADAAQVAALAGDADGEVRVAALSALAALGGEAEQATVRETLEQLVASPDAAERVRAAHVYTACPPAPWLRRAPLRTLVDDADPSVATAACAAVRWPVDGALAGRLALRLDDRAVAPAAAEALARCGPALGGLVDAAADGRLPLSRRGRALLVRAARDSGDRDAKAALVRTIGHADRELGLSALDALRGRVPADDDGSAIEAALAEVVRRDLVHAAEIARIEAALDGPNAGDVAPLRAALGDELALLRRRLLAVFTLRHGAEAIDRIAFQLAQRDARTHALALEWLEITLAPTDRGALAVLDPALDATGRWRALQRAVPLPAAPLDALLDDLVGDPEQRWRRPWLGACALLARGAAGLDAHDAAGPAASSGVADAERWIIDETLAGLRRRRSA